jgi:hypothetical protein
MRSGQTPTIADPYAGLVTPNIEDMKLQLEELVLQGTLSPEEAQTIFLEQSKMNDIQTDPMLMEAQMEALNELRGIGSSGGLNAQSRARLAKIAADEDSASKGRRDSIMQNMQARGIAGSGMEAALQFQNEQDAAMRRSQRDMDVAALAEQQALAALMQSGQLGSQIQAQQFGQQAQIAGANDAISRFNAQNQQNQINQNVQARNQAQAANLAAAQNLSNQNVGLRNTEQQYNNELIQRDFQNEMAKRGGSQQVNQFNAQAQGQNSQNRANAFNQTVGTGLTIGGMALGGPMGAAAGNQLSQAATPQAQPMQGMPSQNDYWQRNPYGMEDGGIVHGDIPGVDSEPRMLMPGEMVVKKDDVPEMLKSMHTKNGEFDVAGFLDQVTGYKYGYKKGKK